MNDEGSLNREGHEFHSCRKRVIQKNRGFSRSSKPLNPQRAPKT